MVSKTTKNTRHCPHCQFSLEGYGNLSRCPSCGKPFEESDGKASAQVYQAFRLLGPWLFIGGLAAIWRVDKAGEGLLSNSHLSFYAFLSLIGIALSLLGYLKKS